MSTQARDADAAVQKGAGRARGGKRAWEERQNAKGQTRRKGDWDCAECGNMNFAKRMRCNKCSAPRPVAV